MLLTATLALAAMAAADASYVAEIEKWRTTREQRLKADGGWLTVTGLFWLKDGPNTFGSDKAGDIVLPASVAPKAGVIEFAPGGSAILRTQPGVEILSGGKPAAAGMTLKADTAEGSPDVLVMGPVSLQVIERGGRYGLRMKDNQSAQRRDFKGLAWYPVSEASRVVARWVPYPDGKTVSIANVLGQVDELKTPGYAVFTVNGTEVRLDPVLEGADAKELFFIFKDKTSGKHTYPAGRYLYTPLPKDGTVVLDFNKAYSPPCAFTAYATCPLPPPQNRLQVAIEAGEKKPAPLH